MLTWGTDIIVTSYPERLSLSNKRTLPEIIRDTITRLHGPQIPGVPEHVRAQRVVEDIVEKASQFEPKFTICGRERTFNHAFAGEIAHVVSPSAKNKPLYIYIRSEAKT